MGNINIGSTRTSGIQAHIDSVALARAELMARKLRGSIFVRHDKFNKLLERCHILYDLLRYVQLYNYTVDSSIMGEVNELRSYAASVQHTI